MTNRHSRKFVWSQYPNDVLVTMLMRMWIFLIAWWFFPFDWVDGDKWGDVTILFIFCWKRIEMSDNPLSFSWINIFKTFETRTITVWSGYMSRKSFCLLNSFYFPKRVFFLVLELFLDVSFRPCLFWLTFKWKFLIGPKFFSSFLPSRHCTLLVFQKWLCLMFTWNTATTLVFPQYKTLHST